MRLGIDWGGTKLEIIALDENGDTLLRERTATPVSYDDSISTIARMVREAESSTGKTGTLGIGIPGAVSPRTGLVRCCPLEWLENKPLRQDLSNALVRDVRIQNDANCFAVSEAVDGAGAGAHVVLGVILGTGCGGGVAVGGRALYGHNAIAAEIGHIPLPWMRTEEFPGEKCWCGLHGCLETWISGTGFQRDYQKRSRETQLRPGEEIRSLDNAHSRSALEAYSDRLARSLAMLVNIIDPDRIVLGGGMSNVDDLYETVPALMSDYVYGGVFETPVVRAQHGDSSGVRGAAWLWS